MPNLQQVKKTLPNYARELTNLYSEMETCYVTVCNIMGDTREMFDDDDEFWEWVEGATPFQRRQANKYLQVHRNVISAHSADKTLKTMPFSVLQEIAKQELPKSTQKKIIGKFKKAIEGKRKRPTLDEVKNDVWRDMPRIEVRITPREISFVWPVFADRLAQYDGFMSPEKAARLFALDRQASPEDIKIMAKHWKQKYHPDKGGNTEEFNTICHAEEVFIDSQKEKEART